MVKHTQKIRPQQLTNYLSGFDYFVGLTLKGLTCSPIKTSFNRLIIHRLATLYLKNTKPTLNGFGLFIRHQ